MAQYYRYILVLVVNKSHCMWIYYFLKGLDSRNSITTNNKFATIARVNQRVHEGELGDSPVVRSLTDSSLIQNAIAPIHRNKQENTGVPPRQIVEITDSIPSSPHLHQAGSRRPVYDGVQHTDSISFVEGFPRYQPHKHYRKTPNREEQDNLKKEKLYSPCLKESSV